MKSLNEDELMSWLSKRFICYTKKKDTKVEKPEQKPPIKEDDIKCDSCAWQYHCYPDWFRYPDFDNPWYETCISGGFSRYKNLVPERVDFHE
jgi:hypothetical protein